MSTSGGTERSHLCNAFPALPEEVQWGSTGPHLGNGCGPVGANLDSVAPLWPVLCSVLAGSLTFGRTAAQTHCLIPWANVPVAQERPAWVDPPGGVSPRAETAPSSRPPSRQPLKTTSGTDPLARKKQAARDLAYSYLDHWSAPNRAALASAPLFYGSSLIFHGRTRSLASVIAEKRRFAERWPDRTYRYRPETTQVFCAAGGSRCTVRSVFDFSAVSRDPARRAAGIGDHELVVSFSASKPVIVSENSPDPPPWRGHKSCAFAIGLIARPSQSYRRIN